VNLTITIVIEQYGVTSNGISMTAKQLAGILIRHGLEVRILCGSGSGTQEKIYETGINRTPVLYQICRSQGMLLALKDEKIIAEACNGADIVHMLMPSSLCKAAKKYCDKHCIPSMAAFHLQPENITSTLHEGKIRFINDLVYRRFRRFYNQFEQIHCPSQMIADQLKQHGYKSQIHVISNGVSSIFRKMSVPKPEPYRDRFIVLMVGRLSPEKRQDLIVEAIEKSQYERNIQLILAGQGPWKQHILALAEKLSNPPLIRYCSHEELVNVINYADLYVHASDAEIEAISCMEAFTCGLVPVISDSPLTATKQFALSEHNLFRQGDSDSLREQMEYWIEHPNEKERYSQQYQEYAKQFSADQCVRKLERVLLMQAGMNDPGKSCAGPSFPGDAARKENVSNINVKSK